ncbi:hypothetical protein [Aeromonas aquatica]|uniref:hypothetical protein n=1 Tax=Aeromonas aquatica TaxID=558964 RepID=UPI00051C3D7C|nr:hypothetical protein [Aeromonas aquatica]
MITDFTELNRLMADTLKKAIPRLKTVDVMPDELADSMQTPAVFIDLESFEPGKRLSGGRNAHECAFAAYCVLSTRTKNHEAQIKNMAAAVAGKVHGQRWSLSDAVALPSRIAAMPGIFKEDAHGLACWVVTWDQTVYLGEEWAPDDELGDGFWLKGCHDHPHRLEDFPK